MWRSPGSAGKSQTCEPTPGGKYKNMCARLVGEGAGHDEGGVAGGAAQVEQAALGQHQHAVAVREDEAVHLRLDVLPLDPCARGTPKDFDIMYYHGCINRIYNTDHFIYIYIHNILKLYGDTYI